ncbi:MAG: porin family protein [Deltaproteobacteria bacterium]|nr:porin family protein [Deltaproteobacteria bacterium]
MRMNRSLSKSTLGRSMALGKVFFAAAFIVVISVLPVSASAFDITGGAPWQARVGPGLNFSLGLNGCLRDFCDDTLDTSVSIGATAGFFYRIIPNLVVFGEIHTGHIPTDIGDTVFGFGADVDSDNGFAFQLTGGAEFHLPLAGWVAPYMGFGMGFAYLRVGGEVDYPGNENEDFHGSLKGLDFQLRFGADFYPFSRVPNLSLGPILNVGMPLWLEQCIDDGDDEECDDPDDFPEPWEIDDDDTPFIVFFGVQMRYGF